MKRKLIGFITAAVLTLPVSAQAAAKNKTFDQWLENYGAWDRLEESLSSTEADTPEDQLERARIYLKTGSASQALQIIEMLPTFEDNATEASRLWYGGQAHRALGSVEKSVLWFSRSAEIEPKDSLSRKRFSNEPALKPLWRDVWRKLFWSARSNYSLSRQTSMELLERLLVDGERIDSDSFWDKARTALRVETGNATQPATQKLAQQDKNPYVTAADTASIVTAMADASLADFEQSVSRLAGISQEPVKVFWTAMIHYMADGEPPAGLTIFDQNNLMKAKAFWSGNVPSQLGPNRSEWLVGNPESAPWRAFRKKIMGMDYEQAMQALAKEKGSLLISEQMATLLDSFSFALALSNEDMEKAEALWNEIDKSNLPISLRVAGMLSFGTGIEKVVSGNPVKAAAEYPVVTSLVAAGTIAAPANGEAPFWISLTQRGLSSAANDDWPLDRLIVLASWQTELNEKPEVEKAKRAATLFDGTDFGRSALLYLSDQAIEAKDLQLAAFYLNRMRTETLSSRFVAKRLDAQCRLELAAGKQDKAYATFQKLLATGEPVQPITRLRISLMLQQKQQFQAAEEQLLALWASKGQYPESFQAEILFWLGEGRQAMGDRDKALDYYMHLAWKYPKQSIWTLTAMYRSAMIYESRGSYDTARKLLKTVVKNADTKEQREAAKARLSAINQKDGGADGNEVPYPF